MDTSVVPPATRARGEILIVLSAIGVTTLSTLPAFLLGSLQTFIRADSGITAGQIGLVIGIGFGAAMATSWPAGRVASLVGTRTALLGAAALSTSALLLVALGPTTVPVLLVASVVAGVGSGAAQPPANAAIVQGVRPQRRSFVFGLKQSSIPMGTLLAGLAIPLVAEQAGWRWAFGLACLLGPSALLAPRARLARPARNDRRRTGWFGGVDTHVRTQLILLAVAGLMGSASANAMGAFLVDWTVASGGTAVNGATLATIGSLSGIIARVGVGILGDKLSGRVFAIVLVQLLAGSVGLLLVGTGPLGPLAVLGVILAFGGGWGWTGMLAHIVTSLVPHDPASATGFTQLGVLAGSALGPPLLGYAFAAGVPEAGWIVMAISTACAGILVVIAGRSHRRNDGGELAIR